MTEEKHEQISMQWQKVLAFGIDTRSERAEMNQGYDKLPRYEVLP